jgi:hypothetical protein
LQVVHYAQHASSIIILASCMTFSAAAFVQHDDTSLFLNAVGLVVGIVGSIGWFASIREPKPKD